MSDDATPPPRNSLGQWLGSGNPSGRPKVVAEITSLARERAPEAFERICELVQSKDERVALAASQALLDRAYGRPMIAVQSEVKTLDMSKLFALAAKQAAAAPAPPTSAAGPIVDAEIVEVTEPARVMKECAKTIDGTKTPATTIDGTEPIDGAVIEQAAIDREEEGIEW